MATEQMRDVQVPLGGKIGCMFLSLTALAVIAIATLRRVQGVKITRTLPLTFFLVVAVRTTYPTFWSPELNPRQVYGSSFLFVFLTAVYRDVGINNSKSMCAGAIVLCLTLYMVTKITLYFFFVERVYIVRGARTPRMKDKLYLVNTFAMLIPYTVVFILNVI
ncbi:hypothetical protein SLS56_007376 [Neofusicoccum ribis]|uniref:Uncharacterized protein n=1 Tax=Neofusicoccum ribis TaxID=45134 RepID=A0ABR3SN55_9PEZI